MDLGGSWDTHFGRQPVEIISVSVHQEPMRSLRSSSSKEMLITSDFIPLPIFP